MKKGLAILGSTGSIGKQTLEVISVFPSSLTVVALAALYLAHTTTRLKRDLIKHMVRDVSLELWEPLAQCAAVMISRLPYLPRLCVTN